jgi:hypothetical protein
MTVLEKIEHFQKVWQIVLPHLAVPCPEDAARWCVYDLENVEMAILRTSKRFAIDKIPAGFDPQGAYRYTTAVARDTLTERTSPRWHDGP